MTVTPIKSNNKSLVAWPIKSKINKKLLKILGQDFADLNDSELIKALLKRISGLEFRENEGKARAAHQVLASGEASYCERIETLIQSFAALGFVAREVILWGTAQQKKACEVWSDTYKKWIFLDPEWGVYATSQSKPLSYYALWCLKNSGKWDQASFVSVCEKEEDFSAIFSDLMDYLSWSDGKCERVLFLSKKEQFCVEKRVFSFVSDPLEFYFPINRVFVEFRPLPENYLVQLQHNMPWFSRFELMGADGWIPVKKRFNHPVGKKIEVRAVNQQGRAGQATSIEF